MVKLFVMVGCPGSGKSTFLKEHVNDGQIISRDQIRYDLLEDGEDYFSKEFLVFDTYVDFIQSYLDKGVNVYADATHLNEPSRNKLLNSLSLENVEINMIVFNTPVETCLERNAKRIGRARVPDENLLSMYLSCTDPKNDKKYQYDNIYYI